MKVSLECIILYSYAGDSRVVSFNDDRLNIITGDSKTGKSAIIHIIDYCFGSETCHVPEGVIRRKVEWYAIVLKRGEERFFIGRQNPLPGKGTSSVIHIRPVAMGEVPVVATLSNNADIAGIKDFLAKYVGIEENRHVPSAESTRPALSANFSHARVFCFQDQSLIDNKNQLFFNQADSFAELAIKDTLPYFLGAVTNKELVSQFELNQLRRDARLLEKKLANQVSWQEASAERADSLLAEAREVGLLSTDVRPTSIDRMFSVLSEVAARSPALTSDATQEGRELAVLQAEREELREELEMLRSRQEEAKAFGDNRDTYEGELAEQKARLAVANIFPLGQADHANCPLCNSAIAEPSSVIQELQKELGEVSSRIGALHSQNPRLQEFLVGIATAIEEVSAKLRANQGKQNAIFSRVADLRGRQENSLRMSHIQGRITGFLETGETQKNNVLQRNLDLVNARISRLEEELTGTHYQERLSNAASVLSEYMTQYARDLKLEHSDGLTRLDLKQLTVIAETRFHGSIKLENMGSGDNWVGCHVLTHMALHRFFRERDRPVPAFLILDQPSKAHYPPHEPVKQAVEDDDRVAVRRLFKFIHDNTAGHFQTIVIDHADEPDEWFQESVIERWRSGLKLVPDEWPERT